MAQEWTQWKPIDDLARKYYVDAVIDSRSCFKVVLSNAASESEKLELVFSDGVDAYTCVEESFRVKIIHELDNKYGTDFYGDWSFF